MSHNKIKVAGQSPNASSEVNLNIADIGSFTSTTNKQLGFNASGDLVQLDAPSSSGFKWIPTYHYYANSTGWGGGSALSTTTSMQYMHFRKTSGVRYIDSSYATGLLNGSANSTWDNQIRLQAGTYLFNACFMGNILTTSDQCIVRLLNITDSTRHGNHGYWGASKYSNNMYAYVTITAQKTFGFSIEALSGSPFFQNSIGLFSTHMNIWRFA